MREIYRILDANFNRTREALRVIEDCGRFALNDPATTAMAKTLRSDLRTVVEALPRGELLTARDTPGDVGTVITSAGEADRGGLDGVVTAACKRLTESLRTLEEYAKVVAPQQAFRLERMRYDAYTLEARVAGRLLEAGRFAREVKLYVLITSRLCKRSVLETARAAIHGGADAVQLREKDLADDQFLALAAELRELTDETGKILIINDRADIAAIVGADGIHLGLHDLGVAEVRRLLRPGAIVGKTSHTLAEAHAAVNAGADYVSAGPLFPTATKPGLEVQGLDYLRQVCAEIPLPNVPIGGITADNVAQAVQAGAKRVAVCAAVCSADDPQKAAETIRKHIP